MITRFDIVYLPRPFHIITILSWQFFFEFIFSSLSANNTPQTHFPTLKLANDMRNDRTNDIERKSMTLKKISRMDIAEVLSSTIDAKKQWKKLCS